MEKKEVIEKLCDLSSKVGAEIFKELEPHDCFCGMNKLSDDWHYQFSEKVFNFIKEAVEEKIARSK